MTATDDLRCTTGWEPLIQDDWQGTDWGCWCFDQGRVEKGKCDDLLDNLLDYFRPDDKCVDIPP